MKCKQCGAEIENSRCCPYCGSENADYDAAADAIQQDEARQNIPGQGEDARSMTVIRVKWLHFC
ncbi:MAG: hypothetical protein ACLRL6_04240 [Clostridium sp.]